MSTERGISYFYSLVGFSIVPLMLLLVRTTDGSILPTIKTEPQQWNIQFLPIVLIALAAGVSIYNCGWRKQKSKFLLGAAIVNFLWAAFFTASLVNMWGEKW